MPHVKTPPRYVIMIGDSEPRVVAPDAESQRGLWFLIRRDLGMERAPAEALLKDGAMIWGCDLIVARQDVLEAVWDRCPDMRGKRVAPR